MALDVNAQRDVSRTPLVRFTPFALTLLARCQSFRTEGLQHRKCLRVPAVRLGWASPLFPPLRYLHYRCAQVHPFAVLVAIVTRQIN